MTTRAEPADGILHQDAALPADVTLPPGAAHAPPPAVAGPPLMPPAPDAPTVAFAVPRRRGFRWRRLFGSFLLTILAVGLFAGSFAAGYRWLHEGKALPGVTVAGVSVAGLDRAAAEARLREQLPDLSAGALTVRIGDHEEQIPYAEIGRDYDMARMLDDALAIGRSGTLTEQAAEDVRTFVHGAHVEPSMHLDADALAERISAIAASVERPPVDATIRRADTGYVVVPARAGSAVDEEALRAEAEVALTTLDPADVTVTAPEQALAPAIPTERAAEAVAQVARVASDDLVLTAAGVSHTVPSDTIASLVALTEVDGGWDVSVEEGPITTLVEGYREALARRPVDAGFAFAGRREVVAVPGRDGVALDVEATVKNVAAALRARFSGTGPPQVPFVLSAVAPDFTTAEATAAAPRVRKVSGWATRYVVYEGNFFGANIVIPTNKIDGTLVPPGKVFDFWKVVGEVSRAQGYGPGGAIIDGRTERTGALGGGICSCSTTIFNAAARAGLELLQRQNHFYYIDRYPIGLDATVWKTSGGAQQTMSFRNDTAYPLLVRGINRPGVVKFEIWSVPSGRTVEFSQPIIRDRTHARDAIEYTDELAPGRRERVEYPTNGFRVWVTRTVRDASGTVIHRDRFYSNYGRVTGITEVGRRPNDPPDGTIVYVTP